MVVHRVNLVFLDCFGSLSSLPSFSKLLRSHTELTEFHLSVVVHRVFHEALSLSYPCIFPFTFPVSSIQRKWFSDKNWRRLLFLAKGRKEATTSTSFVTVSRSSDRDGGEHRLLQLCRRQRHQGAVGDDAHGAGQRAHARHLGRQSGPALAEFLLAPGPFT